MIRSVLGAALVSTIATWAALVVRIVRDPTNHVAVDPLLAVVPFVILASISWFARTPSRTGLRAAVSVYALLSILAIAALDRTNVLVPYERWVARGMPERPCAGIARRVWACKP